MSNDYSSEFEFDSEVDRKRRKRFDLNDRHISKPADLAHKSLAENESVRFEGQAQRFHFSSLSAYDRHKKMVNDYIQFYGGSYKDFKPDTSNYKSDLDIIHENQKFVWNSKDKVDTWEKRMAKKYWDKLFKEYCICDLTFYKYNKIAMRWRVEKEVISGKGQFTCGEKHCTVQEADLRSWEVNFSYVEDGAKQNTLVKLRLCPDCSYKLNYKQKRNEWKPKKETVKKTEPSEPDSYKPIAGEARTSAAKDSSTKDKTSFTSKPDTKDDTSKEPSQDATTSDDVWRKSVPLPAVEELSREGEFDHYFSDMFM